MKAAIYRTYGQPEVLRIQEIPTPVPEEDELLVNVHATTVNRTDCANLTAKPFIMRFALGLAKPRRQVPGTDFAGRVEAVGANVRSFEPGDDVFGFVDSVIGSQAEYFVIRESGGIAKMPAGGSYLESAASIEGFHYALNFINKVKFEAGQRVFVNGASGAIGSAMVQIVAYFGGHVDATCSAEAIGAIASMGADQVIDYQQQDFTKLDELYHYVFDTVGKSSFFKCKHLLLPKGAYISSELGYMIQNTYLTLLTPLFGGKVVRFPYPANVAESLRLVKRMTEEGKYRPLIDRTYTLDEIHEAYAYVLTGKKRGNVVLDIHGVS